MIGKALKQHLRNRYSHCLVDSMRDQLLARGVPEQIVEAMDFGDADTIVIATQRALIHVVVKDATAVIDRTVGDFTKYVATIDLQHPDSITQLEEKIDYLIEHDLFT